MRVRSWLWLLAALAFAVSGEARAHTISFGYVDLGGGTADFWIGSYHAPPVPFEGSLTLSGPVNTAGVFDRTSDSLPAGLVEGENYDCDSGYTCAGVFSWQGTTISGLEGGTYQFDVVGLASAFWSANIPSFLFPRSVLITLQPASPASLPDFELGASTDLERNVGSTLNALYTEGAGSDFSEILAGLLSLPESRRGEALRQLGPHPTPAQVDLLFRSMHSHVGDVRDRLRAVRMGGGGGPLQAFTFAPATREGSGRWLTGGLPPLPRAEEPLSEGRLGRMGPPPVDAAPVASASERERAEGRLAVWARGRVFFGDRDATAREEGFGFDGRGGSAGLDLRLGDHWLLGAAGGLVHTDTDYDGFTGSLDLDTTYGTAYASWLPSEAWSVDLAVSYGRSDLETRRVMRFASVSRRARADGNAHTWAADLEGRRTFRRGALAFAPLVGLAWMNTRVDSLREDGAGSASLHTEAQEVDSLESRMGAELHAELDLAGWIVRPHARAAWRHEFDDGVRTLEAELREAPGVPIELKTADPDRDFAAVSAGIDALLGDRFEAFVRYETVLGLNDWTAHEVSAGIGLRF